MREAVETERKQKAAMTEQKPCHGCFLLTLTRCGFIAARKLVGCSYDLLIKSISGEILLGCLSRCRAFSSIWRILSRVR